MLQLVTINRWMEMHFKVSYVFFFKLYIEDALNFKERE